LASAIEVNGRVRITHRLTLSEGTVVEESTPGEPLEFTLGDGTLPAALEEKLLWLNEGVRASFIVTAAEEVFGMHDPQRVQRVPRRDFETGDAPQLGAIHAFHLPNGMEIAGTIVEVGESDVVVDFNPPLAGRDFVFEVTVLEVEATR
jgi:FKBP-type peptidyl-prolyl cis-trans isomerase SlpA